MKNVPENKKPAARKKPPQFPKVLCLFLFLLAVGSGLLAALSYKMRNEATGLMDGFNKTSEYVSGIDQLSRDMLQANPQELIDIKAALEDGVNSVDSTLSLTASSAPLHLSKTIEPLAKVGLFNGEYEKGLEQVKTTWSEAKQEIISAKIIRGSSKNLPTLKKIEELLVSTKTSITHLKENLKKSNGLLEKLMMLFGVLLVFFLGLLLLTVLYYLFRLNNKPQEDISLLKAEGDQSEEQKGSAVNNATFDSNQKKDVKSSEKLASDTSQENTKKEEQEKRIDNKTESEKMNDKDQEISRLKTLLETLFNDQYRPLCIADSDGDVLMENEAFKSMSGVDSSETTLPEIMQELLVPEQSSLFASSFQKFFNGAERDLKPLDHLKVKGSDSNYRLSLQPFHTQDGELCGLVAIQEMSAERSVLLPASAETTSPPLQEDKAIKPIVEIPEKKSVTDEVKERTQEVAQQVKSTLTAREPRISDLDNDIITPRQYSGPKRKDPFSDLEERKPIKLVDIDHSDEDPFEEESSFAILPILSDLSEKLASVNDKEIELNTKNFDESIIPESLRPVILETLGQAVKFSIPNSVESPEIRKKAGKRGAANIVLSNKYEEKISGLDKPGVVFYYKDDGRGVDSSVILDVARNAKLTSKKKADELTKNEILSFLFNSQFNLPKKHALDVVNLVRLKETVVKNLKGKMRLSYKEGESFSFQLLVPTED